MYISLLTAAIPVNYTSESDNFLKLLRSGYKVIKRKTPREKLTFLVFSEENLVHRLIILILTLSIIRRGRVEYSVLDRSKGWTVRYFDSSRTKKICFSSTYRDRLKVHSDFY
jgi:hypothetical protein